MISPELLRRYPFFAHFTENQLRDIALISEESTADQDAVLFEECQPALNLYLLLEGGVTLYYKSEEAYHPTTSKTFPVGEINPGEIFAISSLIEPFVLNATGRASGPVRFVEINAQELRKLIESDPTLGYHIMKQVVKALMERLNYTRVQLAAAWA